jgi:hypothetical protein
MWSDIHGTLFGLFASTRDQTPGAAVPVVSDGGAALRSPAPTGHSGRVSPQSDLQLWAGYAFLGGQHRVWYSGDTGFHSALAEITAWQTAAQAPIIATRNGDGSDRYAAEPCITAAATTAMK